VVHRRLELWPSFILSLVEASVMSLRVQKYRFKNDNYFQQTGFFFLAVEVADTHMNIRTHIPVRCCHVLEQARRSIYHLHHISKKGSGNTRLLTKITFLTRGALHQRGHWEQKLVEGI